MHRVLLLLAAVELQAAAPEGMSKGFTHFYNLEYGPAISAFTEEIERNPKDPDAFNHLAQAILYREMYNAGALESELVTGSNPFLARAKIVPPEEDQRRFDTAIETAIELSEARLRADPDDIQALFSLGVARGLRANYDFLIRKLWRNALREFTESRKLHNRILEIQPDFIDALLVEGVHDYVVGSLPWTWKFLGFLAGFRGDKEGGLRMVERVAEHGTRARIDAMIVLAVAYRRERQAEKAVPLLLRLIEYFPRNYLYRLELVQMYADLGKKKEALDVLSSIDALKAKGAPGYAGLPAAKIQYSRGSLLFWYRDYTGAVDNLVKASAAEPKQAGLNTVMNSWLRLGQSYDMLGKREAALDAYRHAIEGAPDSDAAKEAQKYVSRPYRRAG